jgi:hypothetical protein
VLEKTARVFARTFVQQVPFGCEQPPAFQLRQLG